MKGMGRPQVAPFATCSTDAAPSLVAAAYNAIR
jgi:hypothetical protein